MPAGQKPIGQPLGLLGTPLREISRLTAVLLGRTRPHQDGTRVSAVAMKKLRGMIVPPVMTTAVPPLEVRKPLAMIVPHGRAMTEADATVTANRHPCGANAQPAMTDPRATIGQPAMIDPRAMTGQPAMIDPRVTIGQHAVNAAVPIVRTTRIAKLCAMKPHRDPRVDGRAVTNHRTARRSRLAPGASRRPIFRHGSMPFRCSSAAHRAKGGVTRAVIALVHHRAKTGRAKTGRMMTGVDVVAVPAVRTRDSLFICGPFNRRADSMWTASSS